MKYKDSLVCDRCEKAFHRSSSDINRGRVKFCSRKCSDEFKRESAQSHKAKVLRLGKKQCKACSRTRLLKYFPKSKTSVTGYFSYCIECRREINNAHDQKRWSQKREVLTRQRRNANYRKNFGITVEEYEERLSKQSNVCAICSKNNDKKLLHVDHDHSTGVIRGILCENCNRGIGMFKDNIMLLGRAINYLSESEK